MDVREASSDQLFKMAKKSVMVQWLKDAKDHQAQ